MPNPQIVEDAITWILSGQRKPRQSIEKQVIKAVPGLTAEQARLALRTARLRDHNAVRRYTK